MRIPGKSIITLLAMLMAAPSAMAMSQPEAATTVTAAPAPGACGIAQPVFCETFDAPFKVDSRSGQLDSVLWGVSRLEGAISLGSNLFNSASASTLDACGTKNTAQPGTTDVIVCNGQLRESSYDEHGVSTLALYPKQPFDFAGRTGVVTFDVSNDTSGSHGTWPEFWITDQPVPAPFSHGGAGHVVESCDLCSIPRNGVNIDLSGGVAAGQAGPGDCPADNTRRWTVAGYKIISNYIGKDALLYSDPNLHALGCVRQSTGPNDALNHVEIRISQNQIDVWATDPGSTVLKHISSYTNANLSFTRGLIWVEDSHYNAEKAADPSTGTPNLANHTFAWDNIGFDGPATYRDISLDVLDASSPTGYETSPDSGVSGKLLNLGWGSKPNSPVTLTTVSGFTQAHLDAATAANRGALLMFNMGDANDGKGLSTINFEVNGHAHSSGLPFSTIGKAYQSIAFPVPISDLVVGSQTITLSADRPMMVTNVNLVLLAAADVPGFGTTPAAPTAPSPPIVPTPAPPEVPTVVPPDVPTVVPPDEPTVAPMDVPADEPMPAPEAQEE